MVLVINSAEKTPTKNELRERERASRAGHDLMAVYPNSPAEVRKVAKIFEALAK